MAKPTLMLPGNLCDPYKDPIKQAEMDQIEPLTYIMDFFKVRQQKVGIENRLLVLKSKTASGKSVALPPRIYKTFILGNKPTSPGLICTQPRRITAINNLLDMMTHEVNSFMRLGENAGWSTQYDKMVPKNNAALFSATLQTLTQQLKTMSDEEICAKYMFILLDECHERSLALDLTMNMLKNFLLRNSANPACPFVCLMSATFNEDVFLNYFIGNKPNKYDNYIFVEGRTAKRAYNYLKEPTRNVFEEIAKTIRKIVDEGIDDLPSKGDVIIFLPSGKNPALQLMLENMNKSLIAENRANDIVSIIQISSNAQEYQTEEFLALDDIELKDQQVSIDKKVYKPRRRVIMSTNVAETGLTLNELKYIIDAGFNAETEFNPILGLEYLATKPAPQSRIEQRIGRVGRKFDGVFYGMYTQKIKENLQENQYPDILTNDITALLLDLIIEQLRKKEIEKLDTVFRFADLDLLDMPAPDSLRYSLEKLYALGAISYGAHKWATDDEAFYTGDEFNPIESISITKVGRTLSKMLNPALSSLEACRMIISGFNWDVAIMDLITIAAYLSAEIKPRDLNAWFYIYQKGLPVVMNERVFIKTRLLVGDQFIEGLILFNSFVVNIKQSEVEFNNVALTGQSTAEKLNKWYKETGLDKVDMIKKFLTTRNAIIDHLLGLRINIFHNKEFALIRQDKIVDTFQCIQRIKKCIYEGYRQNMITLSDNAGSYAKSNTAVNDPKLFTSMRQKMVEHGITLERPRFVLYHSLSLARKKGKEIAVRIETDLVSIMDNYVGVDERFLL